MKIGIDAKRIFNNATGLGVYGRNLLQGLQNVDTNNHYVLFTPSRNSSYFNPTALSPNFKIIDKGTAPSYYWRTVSIINDIKKQNIDIFHGLSNELPYPINKAQVKRIVDIHDLCFLNFKEDYSLIDQKIFWYKTKRAAKLSDKIIATSNATKLDIIKNIRVAEKKINVVYQCCDTQFYKTWSKEEKQEQKNRLNLPEDYILSVGTIQGRKNQKSIVEALALLDKKDSLPLILVGHKKEYANKLLKLARLKKVRVHILDNIAFHDLPGIYQNARLFVFPSFTEGFGIPVLEAMASRTPVLTSENTSMAEIVANEDNLINPYSASSIAEKIRLFLDQPAAAETDKLYERATEFSHIKFAQEVLAIYESL